jgi:nicotinate-nucleotide adenylyltransferase
VRTLVFGGSFNPVHLGHLHLAQEAAFAFGYERVIFVPALSPPHKPRFVDPGASGRLEVLRLVAEGDPLFAVSDCELSRPGPSYSIDTIRYLVSSGQVGPRPGFLLGDDLVPGFPQWKEADALSLETELLIARRALVPGTGSGREGEPIAGFPFAHRVLDNALLPFSSSDVRARAARGLPFKYLVPPEAYRYIVGNGWYRDGEASPA